MSVRNAMVWAVNDDRLTDMPIRQLALLMVLADEPHDDEATTIRALAELLGTPRPAMTRAVDMLERIGLATRRADPRDRRSLFVDLTKAGRDVVKRFQSLANGKPQKAAA